MWGRKEREPGVAVFTHISTLAGGVFTHDAGISDLEIFRIKGTLRLYSASFADGGLMALAPLPGQAAALVDTLDYAPGAGSWGVSALARAHFARTGDFLLPAGRLDSVTAVYGLGIDGSFGPRSGSAASAPSASLGYFGQIEAFRSGPAHLVATARSDSPGLDLFRMHADGSLSLKTHVADTPSIPLGDVADMASLRLGQRSYLFAASSLDAGIASFRVGKAGKAYLRDVVLPGDGGGFSLPTTLETATVQHRKFLLMGAAGSSSISVFKVSAKGMLKETDYRLDDLNTRFSHVGALDSFNYKGHAYVLAGGADDGLTLFELNPDGTLFTLQSLADQPGMSLRNVQAIATAVMGPEIQVFAAGSGTPGITQLSLDLGAVGSIIRGTGGRDTLTGTALDDNIFGGGGRDHLDGGAGNDRLSDGAGRDVLTGGPGQDVFIFRQDGKTDKITDFTFGEDRIDLSGYPMVHDISALQIVDKPWGYVIHVNGEALKVELVPSQLGQVHHFTMDDFIF